MFLPRQGSFFTKNSVRGVHPPPTRTITLLLKIRTSRNFCESPNFKQKHIILEYHFYKEFIHKNAGTHLVHVAVNFTNAICVTASAHTSLVLCLMFNGTSLDFWHVNVHRLRYRSRSEGCIELFHVNISLPVRIYDT